MDERPDSSSADLAAESVGKRKRAKKKPLWYRIIYEDQMVALVRLLGHEGLPYSELREKVKPLAEKFGRERLQKAADEIVEFVGDGDDATARLTEEAHKFAIQLLGRRPQSLTVPASNIAAGTSSPVPSVSETIRPVPEIQSTTSGDPNRSPPRAASPVPQTNSTSETNEPSPTPAPAPLENETRQWVTYETSCVASFLGQDHEFKDECLHLASLCCDEAARCESVASGVQTEPQARRLLLADQLQRLVSEYNPLAEDDSPFADLLDAALSNVDWHDLADSFLKRLDEKSDED